jgi:hypothetical protein
VESVNASMICLIHCKSHCKFYNVPPPSITIKNEYDWSVSSGNYECIHIVRHNTQIS